MKIKGYFALFIAVPMLYACSKASLLDGVAFYYESVNGKAVEGPEVPVSGDSFDEIKENDFIRTADEPVSTFSVDADGAAYAYMRRCLKGSVLPVPNSVRIEEYLNYFTFDYAEPKGAETLAVNAEIASCPWQEGHALLRLGLKGKSLSDSQIPDANYIFLIDTSGSMSGLFALNQAMASASYRMFVSPIRWLIFCLMPA